MKISQMFLIKTTQKQEINKNEEVPFQKPKYVLHKKNKSTDNKD